MRRPKKYVFTLLNVRVLECILSTECILVFIRVSQWAVMGWRVKECSCGGQWSGIGQLKSYARRQVLSSSFNTTPLSLLSLWVWIEGVDDAFWRIFFFFYAITAEKPDTKSDQPLRLTQFQHSCTNCKMHAIYNMHLQNDRLNFISSHLYYNPS